MMMASRRLPLLERIRIDQTRFTGYIYPVNPLDIIGVGQFYRDAESPAVIRVNPELPWSGKKMASAKAKR